MNTLPKLFALGLFCASSLVMNAYAAESINAQEFVAAAMEQGKTADGILNELAATNPEALADATGILIEANPEQADAIMQAALAVAPESQLANIAAAGETAGMAPEDITFAALAANVDPTAVAAPTAAGGAPIAPVATPAPTFALPTAPSAPGVGGGGGGSGGGGFASAS